MVAGADAELAGRPAGSLPDGVDPAFAQSVRFWSRAYPRRWRAAREAELLGILADLAPPGARRLAGRAALDLVRGGWATRLREHPPLGPWLVYRLFGARALTNHRPWVADDIAGALFPLRQGAGAIVVLGVIEGVARLAYGVPGPLARYWWVALGMVLVALLWPGRARRSATALHLTVRAGEAVTPGALVRVPCPRRRLAARAGLPWLVSGLAVVLVACTVAAARARTTLQVERLHPDDGVGLSLEGGGAVPRAAILLTLAIGVGVGLVLAVRAWRHVRALSPVAQPHRVQIGAGPRTVVGALLVVGLAVAVPVAEGLGAVSLALSVPLGLAAGVLAPPLAVTWAGVRRSPVRDDLALVDAWHATWSRGPLRPDEPGTELVPADPALVGVVQPWPYSNEGPTAAVG